MPFLLSLEMGDFCTAVQVYAQQPSDKGTHNGLQM